MSSKHTQSYTRQDLRKATKFVEGDYTGINPRQFYRTLKRSIEEIQEVNDFKYTTEGNQNEDLEIQSEEVGHKTGTVTGRLFAVSDWLDVGMGEIEYRPYGPHGAFGIVLGIIFIFLGLGNSIWAILGIIALGAGTYGYWQQETGEFPIIRQDIIRVLVSGEVSERTVDDNAETRTDIFANMSVVYAGDAFVAVDVNSFDELNWNLRRELISKVKQWNNKIVQTESEEYDVGNGFVWNLKGWTNRSVSDDRRITAKIQDKLLDGPFEYRIAYTEMLEQELTKEMREKLRSHEEDLMVELEDLAEDLDIYVEREGLHHKNRIETKQKAGDRALEAGDEQNT